MRRLYRWFFRDGDTVEIERSTSDDYEQNDSLLIFHDTSAYKRDLESIWQQPLISFDVRELNLYFMRSFLGIKTAQFDDEAISNQTLFLMESRGLMKELWLFIMSFQAVKDVIALGQSCKAFYNILFSNTETVTKLYNKKQGTFPGCQVQVVYSPLSRLKQIALTPHHHKDDRLERTKSILFSDSFKAHANRIKSESKRRDEISSVPALSNPASVFELKEAGESVFHFG